MRTTGNRLSSLLAVAVMATAGMNAIPIAGDARRQSRTTQYTAPKGRGKGPALKRTPRTQADHDRLQRAEAKRLRKGAKFASDLSRSAAGHA